jgi:putative N6-adenine-specific DNA methylase
MGLKIIEEGAKGILTTGTFSDTMALNLNLRTGNRVLYKIADFESKTPKDLYDGTRKIDWENIIPSNGYFSVDSSIKQEGVTDSRFPNLKLKDAIVDRLRLKTGKRPDSGPFKDRIVIFLHWYSNRARIYIDTSGETISKHGYRQNPFIAPMIESLAASTIMASEWDQASPFINPMCGSGTLAIEAALLCLQKPPGLMRANFGFKHIKWFDNDEWEQFRTEAFRKIKDSPDIRIIATDISPVAIRASKENAKQAGVEKYIEFEICDFRDTPMPDGPGVVFLNPEYGERMGELNTLEDTYKEIGDFLKKKCGGKSGFVFTGNLDLAKNIGLRTSKRVIFFNGKIECRLLKYELYTGTKRIK